MICHNLNLSFIRRYLQVFKLVLLPLLLTGAGSFNAIAQEKQGANWFFGGEGNTLFPVNHLDFSGSGVVSGPLLGLNATHGVATISDKHGNFLFSSGSGRVFSQVNNTYQLMPNGLALGADGWSGTVVELIMQSPENEQVYFLFLVTYEQFIGPHDLYMVKVDMRLNSGHGDVVAGSKRLLKRNVGISLAAMQHANQKDFWLVSPNERGDSLQTYPVTAAGIGVSVISSNNRALEKISWFKSSPNSELLVSSGKQGIELFGFNRQAGTVAPLYTLVLPDSSKQKSFAYSFSPNSTKLYVGTYPQLGQGLISIVQFDLAAGSPVQVQQSATVIHSKNVPNSGGFGGENISDMQLALNGKIYVARSDSTQFLGQISYPDQAGTACNFKLRAVKLSTAYVAALPALNQTLFRNAGKLQAQALRDTICLGDSVQLSAYGAGAERFQWQLANGLTTPSDTLANPIVRPNVTTTYRVIASSSFRTDTAFIKVVVLSKSPASLTGPEQVFTFAENQEYKIEGSSEGYTLIWQVTGGEIVSGQSTNHINVNWGNAGTGFVEVIETNRQGCIGNKLSLNVQVSGFPLPVFYNIITPNNDQRNDVFIIENLKWYTENELMIYNRWGIEVYRRRNYQNNWRAEKLSSGIYYYLFKANGQSWKGWAEVVR